MAEFDYIIVGGGSAGCVLANRLSADPDNSVCLLEAGPDDKNPLIHIPMGVASLARGWFANWSFWSVPQKEMGGRRTYQPRGRALGGSSSINATVCTRGNAQDYDLWAEMGCDGWSYQDVLLYFRKLENYTATLPDGDRDFHGFDGPLTVSDRRYSNPLSDAFVQAGIQAGHRDNPDFSGRSQEGVGLFKVFQRNGQRCSNAKAFLSKDVRNRPNLTIMTRVHVGKLLLEKGRATGVTASQSGRPLTLNATREVILSAGAFQSPQLLMLSGIGRQEDLEPHGIEHQHELPGVGQNLQDHLEVIVETKAKSRVGMGLSGRWLLRWFVAVWQFLFWRSGPLTSNGPEAGGFFKSDESQPAPDMQWHFAAIPNLAHSFKLFRMLREYAYIAYVYECQPLSRGTVSLNSGNPLDPPRIDPNYLSHRRDIEKLITGVRKTREVFQQAAFDEHRDVETAPGPKVQTDEQLEEWIRASAETTYHPVGTCKMGVDELAVVDPQLRVHGIDGLRVVDASVMPVINSANTNAPTTMIAEKAADLILNQHKAI